MTEFNNLLINYRGSDYFITSGNKVYPGIIPVSELSSVCTR